MGANAQTSVPAFTAGQVLTAQQQTQINTGIPVFATTTTRDAAFGGTGEKTLAEGQFAYIEASNTTQYYDGSSWLSLAGKIAQVVSVAKTDTFTTTSTTYTDLTGLSVSITPTSTSNTILIGYFVAAVGLNGTNMGGIQLVRGATNILVANTAGSRQTSSSIVTELQASEIGMSSNVFIDSPATTSATTYKLQIRTSTTGTICVNRTQQDTDNNQWFRGCSTLFAMEISA